MFNIVQMPEINADTYRIIKGQVSPAGYPVGEYNVIADDVDYNPARQLKIALERAHHVGAESLVIQPCFVDDETGDTVPQPFGPDLNTEFWCLYQRNPDGELEMIDDYGNADLAHADAKVLAKGLEIEIEVAEWETDASHLGGAAHQTLS